MGIELIKKLKGSCWSDFSVEDFEKLISSNSNILDSIINLSIDNVHDFSWRSAWLISKSINKKNDNRYLSYVDKFISGLEGKKSSHKRELFKIILMFDLNEDQDGLLYNSAVDAWINIKLKPSTRFYAMVHILKIGTKYPSLRKEINFIINDQYLDSLSNGISTSIIKKTNSFMRNVEKEKRTTQ
tara:strand:+ start:109 stop:663 length:555 start_codon:yes stop_codon:yes gene_type:complete